MKNYLLLFLAVIFVGCAPTGIQVTFDDEKSDAIRTQFQNYLNNDMEAIKTLLSPDVKFYLNSTEPLTMDEFLPLLEAQHATFSPITMSWSGNGEVDLGSWVQTINYPEGPANNAATATQAWFTWNATSKLSGETINLPAHIVFVWGDDGKVIAEYHHYDTTEMTAAISAAQAAAIAE